MTTDDERLQSQKPQVTDTIHEQPRPRSENQRIPGSSPLRRPFCGTTLSQGFRVLVPTVVAAPSSGHKVLMRGVGGGRIRWRTVVLYVVPVGYGVSVQVRA
jgi:hypothetical protein